MVLFPLVLSSLPLHCSSFYICKHFLILSSCTPNTQFALSGLLHERTLIPRTAIQPSHFLWNRAMQNYIHTLKQHKHVLEFPWHCVQHRGDPRPCAKWLKYGKYSLERSSTRKGWCSSVGVSLISQVTSDRTRDGGHKLHQGRFQLDIWNFLLRKNDEILA